MASRQLGKLRQWAGEVISSKDKSSISEEFQELEKDIDLRREGAAKLHLAAEAYHHALSKKSLSEALTDSDKLLPIDALGVVMMVHGQEFPEDSDFGSSLIKLGRAHCKVATLQEAYALTFKDTFIVAVKTFREEIKEVEALRKTLESRKAALDTATTRYDKSRTSKKEKDKQEAEEEFDRAQQRYDETAEDLRAHMHAVQDNEITQQRELTHFLDIEINFVQQYLDVLQEVRADWPDKSPTSGRKAHRASVSGRTRPLVAPIPIGLSASQATVRPRASLDSSDSEPEPVSGSYLRHKKSHSTGGSRPNSRPPSRPSSRASRHRANSISKGDDREKKESKDKDENGRPRRFSVAGWASNAVDSVTRTPKVKDKESFASLEDDTPQDVLDGDSASSVKQSSGFSLTRRLSRRKKSKENIPAPSPKVPPRILKPPALQSAKVVHALYDFNGSADELSFKAGTNITVLNEVVDGWWMGEIDGKKGLFPTTHVSTSPPKPTLPARPSWNGKSALSPPPPSADLQEGYLTSDLDEELSHRQPMSHNKSPLYGGAFNDVASFTSQDEDSPTIAQFSIPANRRFSDDLDFYVDQPSKKKSSSAADILATPRAKGRGLGGKADEGKDDDQPLLSRALSEGAAPGGGPFESPAAIATTFASAAPAGSSSPTKKAPPPPPPRRYLNNPAPAPTPAIPERRLGPARPAATPYQGSSVSTFSTSSNESMRLAANAGAGGSNGGSLASSYYDVSPFESAAELSTAVNGGCGQFRQNPFQPEGMCSNCKQFHS